MIENLAKHMIVVKDNVMTECLQFLSHCEMYGKNVKTVIEAPLDADVANEGTNSVTYEARKLKSLLINLQV